MFDIIKTANGMLKSEPQFYKEILFQFCAEYQVYVDDLPNMDTLRSFIESIPKSDRIRIEFEETSSLSYVIVDSGCMEQYESFVNDLYNDDEISINILIEKQVDRGILNVYKTDDFVCFLTSRSPVQSLSNFATLFKGAEKIVFRLLDKIGTIQTENIAFSDGEVTWESNVSRREQLIEYMVNHPFLQAIHFPLMPQDFSIQRASCCDFLKIEKLFAELHDLVSDIYTAKYIYMDTTKIILQKNSSNTIIVLEKNLSDNIADH